MKMTQTDYDKFSDIITDTVKQDAIGSHKNYPYMSAMRYVWDIFHATMDRLQVTNKVESYLFMRSLSDKYNDDHITTALKKILL